MRPVAQAGLTKISMFVINKLRMLVVQQTYLLIFEPGGSVTIMKAVTEKVDRMFISRNFNLIAFSLIAGMILIAYSNTFYSSFHFDDNPSIVENPYIKRVTVENIQYLLSTNRPVVDLTLMLNYQLSGLNVVGWHIFNIGCHIANSFMVYMLILWTLQLPLFAARYAEKAKRMALFGALLFAVHPVQTESVTYIISRSELVTSFFYLMTFFLFIKAAKTNKLSYTIAAFFSSLCAMRSKEWAVTLPAVLFLYDYLFLAEGKIKPVLARWKTYVLIALPWAIVLYKVPLFSSQPGLSYGFGVQTTSGITPVTYLLTSFNVLWTYVRLLLVPIKQNLDYDYPVAKTLFESPTLLSFLGHVVVVGTAFWLYKKKNWLLIPFGVAWFYITLSPVQSFVPIIDVIFEHRVYLPSIGFFIVFIVAYEEVIDWFETRSLKKSVTTS
jgi:hypothetical protein